MSVIPATLRASAIAFAVATMADVATTIHGLTSRPDAVEANPVVNSMIERYGLYGAMGIKVLLAAIVVCSLLGRYLITRDYALSLMHRAGLRRGLTQETSMKRRRFSIRFTMAAAAWLTSAVVVNNLTLAAYGMLPSSHLTVGLIVFTCGLLASVAAWGACLEKTDCPYQVLPVALIIPVTILSHGVLVIYAATMLSSF